VRQAGSPEPAADGGGCADHDAVMAQLGLDLPQGDVGLGIQERAHECLMRLEDRATVTAKAGRSRAAALAKASYQLHGGRRAHVKAQGRLPDGGSAFHCTHDPLTQVSGQRSWHGTSPNHNQLYGISYPDSTQPLHALGTVLRTGERRQIHVSFANDGVVPLGTLTLLEIRSLFWSPGPQALASGPLEFRLVPQGHFLEISGAGATTRFDLSPLLSMEETESHVLPPVLRSIEGRKGDLVVLRFRRKEGPEGTELQHLSARIVLY